MARGGQVMGVGKSGQWRPDAPDVLTNNASLDAWNIESPPSETLIQRVETFAPDAIFHFAGMSIPALCGTDEPTPNGNASQRGRNSQCIGTNGSTFEQSKVHFCEHRSRLRPRYGQSSVRDRRFASQADKRIRPNETGLRRRDSTPDPFGASSMYRSRLSPHRSSATRWTNAD